MTTSQSKAKDLACNIKETDLRFTLKAKDLSQLWILDIVKSTIPACYIMQPGVCDVSPSDKFNKA